MVALQMHVGPDERNSKRPSHTARGHPTLPEASDGGEMSGKESGHSDVGVWAQSEMSEAEVRGQATGQIRDW